MSLDRSSQPVLFLVRRYRKGAAADEQDADPHSKAPITRDGAEAAAEAVVDRKKAVAPKDSDAKAADTQTNTKSDVCTA